MAGFSLLMKLILYCLYDQKKLDLSSDYHTFVQVLFVVVDIIDNEKHTIGNITRVIKYDID